MPLLSAGTTENRVTVAQFDIDDESPFGDQPALRRPGQSIPVHTRAFIGDVRVLAGADMQDPGFADRGGGIAVDIDDMVTEQVLGGPHRSRKDRIIATIAARPRTAGASTAP